jgi:feruloyl esterase
MRNYLCAAYNLVLLGALSGCGDIDTSKSDAESTSASVQQACNLPPTALSSQCELLVSSLQFPNAVFTSSVSVAAGELKVAGRDVGAHCVLTGKLDERTSPVDGQTYSIGFEMRLPLAWNRRFFYQANGGLDGYVATATGVSSGGGPLTSALLQGFAVISSDAGHNAAQNPGFGLDPQARLDYGYQAVGKLTAMAKAVIHAAYGSRPAYSYIGGCSNGGRHTMVAAQRYPDEYDGYLVGSPGFNLPKAAVASIYGGQQYASLANGAVITDGPFAGLPDLSAGFTMPERNLVAQRVLARCDALDGVVDGLVQATAACQRTFSLNRDVPTCTGTRDGSCLTAAQKVAIGNVFSGPLDNAGQPLYSSFPYDSGLAASASYFWDYLSPLLMDSGAVGFVFQTPPVNPVTFIPPLFALISNVNELATATYATNALYTESSQSFMVPPNLTRLDGLKRRGGKMVVYHGTSDPIFSSDDTARWYSNLDVGSKDAVRLYLVPGMNHCGDGPAVDQFDLLTPLMRWVEQGDAPARVVASARGLDNPGGPNFDLPPDWSPARTRPLCAYPRVATYVGGDVEKAESFICKR